MSSEQWGRLMGEVDGMIEAQLETLVMNKRSGLDKKCKCGRWTSNLKGVCSQCKPNRDKSTRDWTPKGDMRQMADSFRPAESAKWDVGPVADMEPEEKFDWHEFSFRTMPKDEVDKYQADTLSTWEPDQRKRQLSKDYQRRKHGDYKRTRITK